MSGSVQGMDGQAGTAGTAGTDGANGPGAASGSPGANGTAGTAGQGVSATIASDQTGPLDATGGTGGGGGSGGKGGDSLALNTNDGVNRFTYSSGGDAGNAGAGGAGGDAVASVLVVPDVVNSLRIVAVGGNGGSDGQDQAGVAGSTGQYERSYEAQTGGSTYTLVETSDAGVGGHGGAGTAAGKGGDATAKFDGQTGVVGSVAIELDAQGGIGGDGGAGSDGGSGSDRTASTGGMGGSGGAGGDAHAEVSGWNVTGLAGAGLQFTVHSLATAGGTGGAGGRGGFAERRVDYGNGPNDSHTATDTFGNGGDAGAGGNTGTATAGFTGNTIAGAAAVSLDIGVGLGSAGQGGTGGLSLPPGEPVDTDVTYVGQAPGQDGAAGTAGTGAVAISNNTISVTGEFDLTIGSPVALVGQALSFTFAGNRFDGGGSGTFHLAAGGGAGFASVFDVRDHTLSIAGSAANGMTGFSTFTNDSLGGTFIDGSGAQTYNVTANGGGTPDEVVFQPGHGTDTVDSAGVGTLLIDLAGFGAALNSFAQVQADASSDVQGDTVITTPDAGEIILPGIAPADLTAGNFSFDAAPACYCRGTGIATPQGEVPVEDLAIGDWLLTSSGAARRVRWIGRRSYAGRFVIGNPGVWPVIIRAGALEDGVPTRDLFVSPEHALYLDDILVPACALVNGVSIVHGTAAAVHYFHIELDSHDVILANGAPAETFIDDGNRGAFQNAPSYAALYPHADKGTALRCAPRASGGYVVQAIRARLMARSILPSPRRAA